MTRPFRLAIQEDMLPGPTLEDRFAQAADLGLQGIEFWSESLPAQAMEIGRLSGKNGVVASSINNGRRSRFLDPDPGERGRAVAELTEAIQLGQRIGATGVVFVPHFFGPLLPDVSPFLSAVELERGLLRAQLESLAQEADRADIRLWVEPVNRYETHLLVRLEDAASLVQSLNRPQLGIVADLFHMALEEADIPGAIRRHGRHIGHVHLADSNRRLPGQGFTPFPEILQALKEIGYGGWLAFECGEPGKNLGRAQSYSEELPASLKALGA